MNDQSRAVGTSGWGRVPTQQGTWTKRLYWDVFYSTDEPKENLPVTHAEMEGFGRHVLAAGARTAIDVGSGWGLLATLMAREGLRTVGYDWSPVAVDRARTFWGKEKRLSFEVHDFLTQTPPRELVPGTVDVVACRLTLPYLDRHSAMADFRRWLKPRTGVLYLVVQVRERQHPGKERGFPDSVVEGLRHGWRHSVRWDLDLPDAFTSVLGEFTALALTGPEG